MRMAPLAFISSLQSRLNTRADELPLGPIPEVLAHYTSCQAVKSIADKRSLWATCLADQSDTTELQDSILTLQECASHAAASASEIGRQVLEQLPDALRDRRPWLFITCFCADSASRFHLEKYGHYRLDVRVSSARGLNLRPSMFEADCWIRRCIYDQDLFSKFGAEAIQDVVSALQQYSDGELSGPWASSIARRIAEDVAEVLLTVAASVKNPSFRSDQELRFICSPPAGLAKGARATLDRDFAHWVRTETLGQRKVHYVELRKHPRNNGGRDDVPFFAVQQDPLTPDEEERKELNEVLARNTDVLCQ